MKLLPFTPSPLDIEASLEIQTSGFVLSVEVSGNGADQISVSPRSPKPIRKNDLWQETCFEVFFGVGGSKQYFEFNGSTSGDWAMYAFDDYRAGMKDVALSSSPVMEKMEKSANGISCVWNIPYFTNAILQSAGLTAVIKAGDATEYWALKHAGEKPDFHRRESFIHRLI